MDFVQSLKSSAEKIINLSSQLGGKVKTWDQQQSAPAGGFTDRAGFLTYDGIELYADVALPENEAQGLLRARLAKDTGDEDVFTIITLDFHADAKRVSGIIAQREKLTQQHLLDLLQEESTTPKLIHVSLGSGRDKDNKPFGRRYEYTGDQVKDLSDKDREEFLSTLTQAYEDIASSAQ